MDSLDNSIHGCTGANSSLKTFRIRCSLLQSALICLTYDGHHGKSLFDKVASKLPVYMSTNECQAINSDYINEFYSLSKKYIVNNAV